MEKPDIVAVFENVRSAFNVGSFFRTADGAGIKKLFLAGITPKPPHKMIAKTALGAETAVAWEHVWSAPKHVVALKEEGYTIVVVERTKDALDYSAARYDTPLCLVFGHEVDGVSDEVLALADSVVAVPMRGVKESLNVSATFAIIAYEATKNMKV